MALTTNDKTAANSRGLNVSTRSTVVRADLTSEADCSAFTSRPVDGEFVAFKGFGGASAGQDTTSFLLASQPGAMVRMVWGHENRTDKQALAAKRTTVLMGGITVDLSLYNYKNGVAIAAGDYVCVAPTKQTYRSQANRWVADIQPAAGFVDTEDAAWVVGVVLIGAAAGDLVEHANGSAKIITVRLYHDPVFLMGTASP